MPILLNSSKKIEPEGRLPNSLYETSINLITKLEENTSRKLQINIHDKHRLKKNLNKVLANRIQQHIERIIHYDQVEFNPWDGRMVQHTQIHKCDTAHYQS